MPALSLNRAQSGSMDRIHPFWVQFTPAMGMNRAQNRGRTSAGEDDLAGGLAGLHRAEGVLGLLHRHLGADLGLDAGLLAEGEEVGELVLGAHGGADDLHLEEEDPLQLA